MLAHSPRASLSSPSPHHLAYFQPPYGTIPPRTHRRTRPADDDYTSHKSRHSAPSSTGLPQLRQPHAVLNNRSPVVVDKLSSSIEAGALPCLSPPSRPPLFDDDEDDDEAQVQEEEGSDEGDEVSTPSSQASVSWSSSPSNNRPSASLGSSFSRKALLFTAAPTDPLLSPPAEAARLDFSPAFAPAPLASAPPPTTTFARVAPFQAAVRRTESLLTKSLRGLAKLPNLSLPTLGAAHRGSGSSSAAVARMYAESNASDWEWHSQHVSKSRTGSNETMRGSDLYDQGEAVGRTTRLEYLDDCEASSTLVQLQTFSPPPSPKRSARTKSSKSLPIAVPPPPLPLVILPPSEPTLRFISNPRHLLMLALEFSMVSRGKITSPLRPRGVVVRMDVKTLGHGTRDMVESKLRWEVGAV